MMLGGDEMGRTQKGNNNTYCQDSELSWLDWKLRETNADLLEFTRKLIHFRHLHPVFCRRAWFQGREIYGSGVRDIAWYNPDGLEISDKQWHEGSDKAIGIFLNGEELLSPDPYGERIVDDSFLLFFNANLEMMEFAIPLTFKEHQWKVIFDTKDPVGFYRRWQDLS